MNITLTAHEDLIAKAREYAVAHNTTLNQLIRDHLERLVGLPDGEQVAAEFADLARNHAGRSEDGFVFDRGAVHVRGGWRP